MGVYRKTRFRPGGRGREFLYRICRIDDLARDNKRRTYEINEFLETIHSIMKLETENERS